MSKRQEENNHIYRILVGRKEKLLENLDPLSRFLSDLTTAVICILRLRNALDDAINHDKDAVSHGKNVINNNNGDSNPGKKSIRNAPSKHQQRKRTK